MNVAIIPARGGSKRIPRKNIKNFCGKPMIAWTITTAKKAGIFDKIIVSTDDPAIAQTAIEYGAEAPFKRPDSLADDITPTIPVIRHAIEWLMAESYPLQKVCCLYATAPFVTTHDLIAGMQTLDRDPDCEFVVSATEFSFPIERSLQLTSNGHLQMNHPEHALTRSQDLPRNYHDAGQFYWGHAETYLKASQFFTARSRIQQIPTHRVQDIDTPEDWKRAEMMFQYLKQMQQDESH